MFSTKFSVNCTEEEADDFQVRLLNVFEIEPKVEIMPHYVYLGNKEKAKFEVSFDVENKSLDKILETILSSGHIFNTYSPKLLTAFTYSLRVLEEFVKFFPDKQIIDFSFGVCYV